MIAGVSNGARFFKNFQMPFLKMDLEIILLTYSVSFNTIEAEKFPNMSQKMAIWKRRLIKMIGRIEEKRQKLFFQDWDHVYISKSLIQFGDEF